MSKNSLMRGTEAEPRPQTLKLQADDSGCERLRTGEEEKAPPGFEPGMADLQSAALPLG
jgi:hypothetical protein